MKTNIELVSERKLQVVIQSDDTHTDTDTDTDTDRNRHTHRHTHQISKHYELVIWIIAEHGKLFFSLSFFV